MLYLPRGSTADWEAAAQPGGQGQAVSCLVLASHAQATWGHLAQRMLQVREMLVAGRHGAQQPGSTLLTLRAMRPF